MVPEPLRTYLTSRIDMARLSVIRPIDERGNMNANARAARATLRTRHAETRAARKARRSVSTGTPQSARAHLVAVGLSDADAARYARGFSRGVVATTTTHRRIKLKGRVTRLVTIKLYDTDTFRARLARYRPVDKAAAARFAAIAA